MEEQLKSQIRNSFTKLRNAIDLREKLLLRQIDVLKQRPDSTKINFSDISFLTSTEEDTLNILRNYGSFQNLDSILPFLENENEEEENVNLYDKKIKADLDCLDNKILSESIINLTVKESQELISKSNDLKLMSVDLVDAVNQKLKNILPSSTKSTIDKTKSNISTKEESKSSIKQATAEKEVKGKESETEAAPGVEKSGKFLKRNNGTTSSKKKVLKNISNLTLNNCGTGSIILKNISNLTINTCKQSQKSQVNEQVNPRACKDSKNCEVFTPTCEFYEKLISENEALKRTIVHQSVKCTTFPDPITAVCMSPTNAKDEKNDETYSITNESITSISDELEDGLGLSAINKIESPIEEISTRTMHLADSFLDQPPIIKCWLSNLDTELENNIEILEFSKIA
ncbi:hypothetical protein PVAND_008993 [Polypedilum vanderplanki]|uniref:Uncharacterized protein n=1 Tax=Polypedilum vanderplanki TaxID=319348 RepID=A0A9J6CBJ1_POLVA|nr:hypothetical protein PVAND_008993 [Polypedilum vanderplanki]